MNNNDHPEIIIRKNLESINLCRGETFTVWAKNEKRYLAMQECCTTTQIELRITNNGEIEIFCNEKLDINSFASWKELS